MVTVHRQPHYAPHSSAPFVMWTRAFALAMIVHSTLPDFDHPAWLAPQIIGILGSVVLLWKPRLHGFALCIVSLVFTLFFLRDVLTQSMYLLWVAALGAVAVIRPSFSPLSGIRGITAGTYLIAAVHKVNTGFLDPTYSCAHHAAAQVSDRWSLLTGVEDWGVSLSILVIVVELLLAIGIWRGRPWIWLVGAAFHIPLTATLAPAFGAVMFSGYVSCLTARQLVRLKAVYTRYGGVIVSTGLASMVASMLHDGHLGDWWIAVKLGVAVALVTWSLFTLKNWVPSTHSMSRVGLMMTGLWCLHGLTPYLGVQYQHTCAMLSNLRIDEGCHNSLLFPEGLVLADPYIRIDEAQIGQGQRARREQIVTSTLWNVSAIHTMRRNWCVAHLRPISLKGTWEGEPFELSDLCAESWLDDEPRLRVRFEGFQTFQKNLLRACPAPCIH